MMPIQCIVVAPHRKIQFSNGSTMHVTGGQLSSTSSSTPNVLALTQCNDRLTRGEF